MKGQELDGGVVLNVLLAAVLHQKDQLLHRCGCGFRDPAHGVLRGRESLGDLDRNRNPVSGGVGLAVRALAARAWEACSA